MATPDQIRRRGRWSLVLGTLFAAVALTTVAIASDVDTSVVDTTAPTGSASLAPGTNSAIQIKLAVTGRQSNPATPKIYKTWTLTGGTFVGSDEESVNVAARAATDPPSVYTVNGSVLAALGHAPGGPFTLAIKPHSVTTTPPATLAIRDASSYEVTVTAPLDATPPVVTPTVTGTLGNNGWYTSDVTVSWSVVDVESPISSSSGCSPTTIDTDTAGTTLTCTATSAGGTSSQSVTIKRDATAPTIRGNASPAPNGNGWNNTNVIVSFTCSDAMSGVAACAPDQEISSEGAGQSASGSATDNAGNLASTTVSGINIDKTAPQISDLGPTTGPNVNGWYKSDVVNRFQAEDALSGLDAACETAFPLDGVSSIQSKTTTGEGNAVTVSSDGCADLAGNNASSIESAPFMIDKTDPAVTCVAASFVLNEPGAQVSASVTDLLSGPLVATEHGAADTSSVGLKSVSITGYDNAGNSTTANCSYTVGYAFAGLFAPIDKPNTMNVSKAGQAIPLKWRLMDYFGNPVTNLASAVVTVTGIACSLGSSADQVEEVAAGSSGLQNLGDGYYQINWKSPTSYAGSCKSLNLNLGEGMTRTSLAYISFKK